MESPILILGSTQRIFPRGQMLQDCPCDYLWIFAAARNTEPDAFIFGWLVVPERTTGAKRIDYVVKVSDADVDVSRENVLRVNAV